MSKKKFVPSETPPEARGGSGPVYLDCNATAPMEPLVAELVQRYLVDEFGNEGSRTHVFGATARQAVQKARDQVAAVVGAKREEVIFTSGATESNNLSLLGLAAYGAETGRRHLICTAIEHKAVLEPLEHLAKRGFELTLITVDSTGRVSPEAIQDAIRPDTLVVSVMHVNNETGVIQPLPEVCKALKNSEAYLHVDAAQGFGKEIEALKDPRIDLISVSGHKVYAPKGVGALVVRRRGYDRPPLEPLTFGGGQERGLRPGTIPVALVAGLGIASELAVRDAAKRKERNLAFRDRLMNALHSLSPVLHGSLEHVVPHTANLHFPGIDSEALMVALKDLIAISNGSACTSHSYSPSHVLQAMGLEESAIAGAVRLSWCHLTPEPNWGDVIGAIESLR